MTAPDYDRTITASASGGPFAAGRPAFVVIHSTEGPMSDGNAVALAQWFARSKTAGGPGTSATGIFDPVSSVRMLPEQTIPYHCGPEGNPLSNGDEHCGSVNLTREQWLSARGKAMLDASARVQAQRARYRGWSLADCRWLTLTEVARKTVRGFCTHNDVRLALGGTTHSDPGRNFPYDWYIGRVRYWYQNPNGTPIGEDMPYSDWPDADKQALLDDLTRQLGQGKKIDGTSPPHLVDASLTKIREVQDLIRVGDQPKPAGGDTHPENLGNVVRLLGELADAVEALTPSASPVPPAGA